MAAYWDKMLYRRVSRRRALVGSSGLAASAAFLAACGSDDPAPTAPPATPAPGEPTPAVQPTEPPATGILTEKTFERNGMPGGTLLLETRGEPVSLDVQGAADATLSALAPYWYSRLTMMSPGEGQAADGSVTGDVAESWEWSPDLLQLTFHLRENIPFHDVAPVNGRMMDMDDVLFSWNRFTEVGVLRRELVNEVNPNAPVLSVSAPDERTLVFNLDHPNAAVPILLSIGNSGNPHILPKEVDGGFDIRQTVIGTGPWYVTHHEPATRFEYRKHPNYFRGDGQRPFIDEIEMPIVPEYAGRLAQFESGAIHHMIVGARDILDVVGRRPGIRLYADWVPAVIAFRTIFGYNPELPTPFRDERLRQAYSMAMDRDLFIDVVFDTDRLESEGLPVERVWNTIETNANFYAAGGWWLDPQGPDFGPNARFFQLNREEARKLIEAAGHPDGVEVISSHITTAQYNTGGLTDFPQTVELIEGMASEVGFSFVKNIVDYNVDFQPVYRDGRGQHEGLSYKLGPSGGGEDGIGRMMFFLHSAGGGFVGMDPDGAGTYAGDPFIDQTLDRAKGLTDPEERKAAMHEVERYIAEKVYSMKWPGGATSYSLAWEGLRNFQAQHLIAGAERYTWEYLDESLPPFR